MATITNFTSISLDGVMQGLGRPDEDTRNGFAHGGWGDGYHDQVSAEYAGRGMNEPGGLLLGRRTYADLLSHWTRTPEPNPFAQVLLETPKYVASRSEHTVLDYPESTLLAGDVIAQVAELRRESDLPLTILGSGELTRALHTAGLVDEYVLLVHPLVLGSGTRLFGSGDRVGLDFVESLPTTTGVLIARYAVRH